MHNGVILLQIGKFVRWKGNKSWSCKMWRIIKCLLSLLDKILFEKMPFKLGQNGELQILCFLKTRKLHDSSNYRSSSSRKMVYKKHLQRYYNKILHCFACNNVFTKCQLEIYFFVRYGWNGNNELFLYH